MHYIWSLKIDSSTLALGSALGGGASSKAKTVGAKTEKDPARKPRARRAGKGSAAEEVQPALKAANQVDPEQEEQDQ